MLFGIVVLNGSLAYIYYIVTAVICATGIEHPFQSIKIISSITYPLCSLYPKNLILYTLGSRNETLSNDSSREYKNNFSFYLEQKGDLKGS